MISIIQRKGMAYPAHKDAFSPDEVYPEYRLGNISDKRNDVYSAIRDSFIQVGLDADRMGTTEWNPLGRYIKKGSKVFVLCNFVQDRLPFETEEDFQAKCVHGAVIRAIIDYLLIAVGPNGHVLFGNAPLQNTDFDAVLSETGSDAVRSFYIEKKAPVECADLRLFVALRNVAGGVTRIEERSCADGIAIDLGRSSLLAELSPGEMAPFRVHGYDHNRTMRFHHGTSHTYVVHRHILEADTIVSVPKLKTHEKVGVTLSLKGCVGTIAHKDSLAHHRVGPPSKGGDEYPSDPLGWLRLASRFHDYTYSTSAQAVWGNTLRVLDTNLWRLFRRLFPIQFGSWWGNDTAWRMALDTARIAYYGTVQGMQNVRVRNHLVLIDGVVGGERQGPLRPKAVRSGVILFADDPVMADYIGSVFMGFNPEKIPMIRESLTLHAYPLAKTDPRLTTITFNNSHMTINEMLGLVRYKYRPSKGWIGHIE